ncbi:uncharacterized protein LOC121422231 [Lytechinus variegatus]|uniref:uncharacterized protein LOC121422231 n=1 Tax=Lytechinus variegatus TaxID=7654 RepID=UPI001BB1CBA0|nr:uncharacterized protein LOC121422231 [Lytechinus variegatus]
MIITNVQDIHECARMCLDAAFLCGIFEYYKAGTITDVKNETKPIYDCLITGPSMQMVPLQSSESKRINFHQFVRRIDIAGGQNAVFTSATEVILSPSYLPITPFNLSFFSSSPLSWTIYLSELNYNTLIFKMLAVKGHIDCGGCSSFSLLSVNGGGNVTATAGKVGIAKCLDEFVVGEIFYVDSSEAFITYFATDLVYTGFMLEYKAKWLCNQSFITSPGSISSPRFYSIRQAYPPNVRCHYTITAPPDHVISLHINSYQIEPDREEGACDFDSLSIFDGNSTLAPRVEYLCGFSQAPVMVLSNSSSLYLLFSSDQSGEYTGFAASFLFIDQNLEDLQHEDLNKPADVTGFESFQEFINDMYETSPNSKPTTTSRSTHSEAIMPSRQVTAYGNEVISSTKMTTYSKGTTTLSNGQETPHNGIPTSSQGMITYTTKPITSYEDMKTVLPGLSHLQSTAVDLEYIFKVTLVVILLVFILLAIALAVLYCRIKRENEELKKHLHIHRNGHIVSL